MAQQPTKAVDSESARELLKAATKLGSAEALEEIGARLELKAELFAAHLSPQALPELDREGLGELLGSIFSLRSRRRRLLAKLDLDQTRAALAALLHDPGPVGLRFDVFVNFARNDLGLDPRRARALTSELLHFVFPRRYWLWSWWIWDPDKEIGVLKLLTEQPLDLSGDSDGAVYEKVGRLIAALTLDGMEEGYARMGRGLLGTDVFLACAQVVYVFTVYRMRISQEFTRFLPELPELARRLLGVEQIEGAA